jgi:hypothetical protein
LPRKFYFRSPLLSGGITLAGERGARAKRNEL